MISKALSAVNAHKMLDGAERVIVGLSGGADSVALLHFLDSQRERYGFELYAAHVNHLLRGDESDRDEQFVRELCGKMGVKLDVLRVDIDAEAKKRGIGQEECGRQVRYEFFSTLSDDKTRIATAHTLSDSLETILLNISRGTGIHGLCGISAVRGNVIRPLIECTRQEIEQYCSDNGLCFVNDSSNFTRDYNRNIVRLDIIPKLLEINPSLYKVVLRMIHNNIADDDFLRSAARDTADSARQDDGYCVGTLLSAPDVIRRRALSVIVNECCGIIPEDVHISALDSLLISGGMSDLPQRNTCTVKNGKLFFNIPAEQELANFSSELELYETVTPVGVVGALLVTAEDFEKNYKKTKKYLKNAFDYDKISGKLIFRNRIFGDEVCLSGRKCTKTLKKLFNEAKIPACERSRVLMLCDDEGIVWIDGFGVAERVRVSDATKQVLIIGVKHKEE
ncbi:MAG: tRNA lysidine(34) synthetase TilS [Clostridia bacterium]|nr:tRNA lysidine(34) synthetase TilS [Clostridia bacterium]